MATKKRAKKNIKRRRVHKKSELPFTKIDQHYIALRECFLAARRAGFTPEQAFWLLTESRSMPDWIASPDKDTIIPAIDPTEEDED
jgi:hypothetical protein